MGQRLQKSPRKLGGRRAEAGLNKGEDRARRKQGEARRAEREGWQGWH